MLEQFTAAQREQLEPHWQRAFAFVEKTLGGRIVRSGVHPRWRPAYYLDVEVDGEIVPLYFRGDRGDLDHGVYTLEHESRVLIALERDGIPVPHVYGFCEDPLGIVMARVEGRPDLSTAETPEEAQQVFDAYIDILARMHAIDVKDLDDLGLETPQNPDDMALGDFDRWEATYRRHEVRPDPIVEFLIRWVRTNAPPGRTQVSLLSGDSGQFLFEDGHVTTLLDLENAYLGDPAADLAGLFARDTSEPMPNLEAALERYAEKSGTSVDRRVVTYHTIRWGLCTPLCVAHLVAEPTAELEFIQYLAWYWTYCRCPIEWVAKLEGIELEPWTPPADTPSRHHAGHEFLRQLLAALPAEDSMAQYQRGVAERAAVYLERADRFGPALEVEDLDEAAGILGWRPGTWQECDAELAKIVRDPDPERDAALIRLFYRRCRRNEWLMQPVLKELTDATYQKLSL